MENFMKDKNVSSQYLSFYPYYARHGQDKFLNENIFKNKKNGIFVDIGAYDGIESSNTLFFEESLNWTGVCVEPLSDAFKKLQKNRNCIFLNKCVADINGKSEFMHVNPDVCPPSTKEKNRTANYEKMSGLVKFYDENHIKLIDNIIDKYGGSKNTFIVECVDVNKVLELTNSLDIDLLSIDTEGSELCILKHIDFFKFNIDVIVIEVLYDAEEILKFMESQNYKKKEKIGYDWIFKKD
jgi:FkbM family methyltransferase